MKKVRTRKVKTKTYRGRWITAFALVCCFTVGPQLFSMWEMSRDINAIEDQKRQALQLNHKYQQEIKLLNSDQMVEKIAREELGMIKPNEQVLVQVEPMKQSSL